MKKKEQDKQNYLNKMRQVNEELNRQREDIAARARLQAAVDKRIDRKMIEHDKKLYEEEQKKIKDRED